MDTIRGKGSFCEKWLMQVYRNGLVRKARSLKVAVERGLKPALNSMVKLD